MTFFFFWGPACLLAAQKSLIPTKDFYGAAAMLKRKGRKRVGRSAFKTARFASTGWHWRRNVIGVLRDGKWAESAHNAVPRIYFEIIPPSPLAPFRGSTSCVPSCPWAHVSYVRKCVHVVRNASWHLAYGTCVLTTVQDTKTTKTRSS